MAYLNLDDNFPGHPKVEGLSDKAFRLSIAAMAYSAKFGLDGHLTPVQMSNRPGYKPSTLRELLSAGLLHGIGEGCGTAECPEGREGHYLLHDFLHWNKPASWWDERRKKEAERKAEWRAKRAAQEEGQAS